MILRREVPDEVERYVRGLGVFEATEPIRVVLPPSIAPGHRGRLAVPVRYGEQSLGALWIVDDGRALGEEQLRIASNAARRAGLLLYEERLNERLGSQMLAQLLSGVGELRREAATELRRQGFTRTYEIAVLRPVRSFTDEEHRIALGLADVRIAGRPGERLVLAMPDHVVILDAPRTPDGGDAPREAVLQRLDGAPDAHGHRWVCGIADARTHLADARTAHQEALRAAELAARTDGALRIRRWSGMGPYRMLLAVDRRSETDPVDDRVRPLLSPGQTQLAETVERFLDRAGDVPATARDLGVHRATVYYRLARVEALTGLDLSDGLDRLTLHMALKLRRIEPSDAERDR